MTLPAEIMEKIDELGYKTLFVIPFKWEDGEYPEKINFLRHYLAAYDIEFIVENTAFGAELIIENEENDVHMSKKWDL